MYVHAPARDDQVVVLAHPTQSNDWAAQLSTARAAAALPVDEPFAVLVLLSIDPRPEDTSPGGPWDVFVRDGLFYLSAWGPGCESVHDEVDSADVLYHLDDPSAGAGNAMTVWCEGSLDDALLDFVTSAKPMEDRRDGRLRLVLLDYHVDPRPVMDWFGRHHWPITPVW